MLYKPINIYDSFWSQHIFGEIKKKISLRVTEELLLIQWWECYFWHAFKTALVCTHGINAVTERKYSIIYVFNTLLTNWKGSPHLTCPFLLQLIVFRFFFRHLHVTHRRCRCCAARLNQTNVTHSSDRRTDRQISQIQLYAISDVTRRDMNWFKVVCCP